MATATFQDSYFGAADMILKATKTTRNGQRTTIYRWQAAPTQRGCITTGLSAFSSVERAIAAANRHHGFSNVAA